MDRLCETRESSQNMSYKEISTNNQKETAENLGHILRKESIKNIIHQRQRKQQRTYMTCLSKWKMK